MKKRNKPLLIVTFLSVLCLVGGCNDNNGNSEQRYDWPLATSSTEDTITHIFATAFAEEVYRLSNGKMKIRVYPQSSIGTDREVLESLKDGDIPFTAQSPATQVVFMPEVSIFDLPCVFDNIEDARTTIDRENFLDELKPIYLKSGYRLLGIADQGFRVMTSNRKFDGIESLRGLKIRTMENPIHLQFWRAIGANPTPMTFSEVYIGLQQGTIDAQENSYSIIASAKIYEQQKYAVEIQALPDFITLIVSESFYQQLPVEQQRIIDEASFLAQRKARDSADITINEKKQELLNTGMQIIELDEEIRSSLREDSISVHDIVRAQTGKALFESYVQN